MGAPSTTTNENGAFRIPSLPPGEYTVKFELTGFGTVIREGIRVGVGFTATVNTEMNLASVAESVTVSGQSPVVDLTSPTKWPRALMTRCWRACPARATTGRCWRRRRPSPWAAWTSAAAAR